MALLLAAPRRRAATFLLAWLGGCAGPVPPVAPTPGFSADTATREGLISGATTTEAACAALPDGLWVRAGDRPNDRPNDQPNNQSNDRAECLRFSGGPDRPVRRAIIYIPGDPGGVAYRNTGGEPEVETVSDAYELSDAARHASARARSAALGGTPVLVLGRPGLRGSSGDHARDRHTAAEVGLVDAGLTALRRRFGIEELVLLGFSSGGAVVANLLARRNDIACAVIGSAPLDLEAYYRRPDGSLPDSYAMRSGELADPLDSLQAIRPGAEIYVIGDRRDRLVPASSWTTWVTAAERRGLHVHAAEVAGLDRPEFGRGATASRHLTISRGFEVARACAIGMTPDQVMRALQADAPLLVPQGRRLHAAEIRAALSGHRLRGLEWEPAVNVLSAWGEDGVLTYLALGQEARPVGQWRWRIEGDRLCTTRHGCGEVLANAGALHLVSGQPARLRLTLLSTEEPAVPRSGGTGGASHRGASGAPHQGAASGAPRQGAASGAPRQGAASGAPRQGEPAVPRTDEPTAPGTGEPTGPRTGEPATPGTGEPAVPRTGRLAPPGNGEAGPAP